MCLPFEVNYWVDGKWWLCWRVSAEVFAVESSLDHDIFTEVIPLTSSPNHHKALSLEL